MFAGGKVKLVFQLFEYTNILSLRRFFLPTVGFILNVKGFEFLNKNFPCIETIMLYFRNNHEIFQIRKRKNQQTQLNFSGEIKEIWPL